MPDLWSGEVKRKGQALDPERGRAVWADAKVPMPEPLAGVVTFWCCSVCGKWSHAKTRPNWHERFIRNDEDTDAVEAARAGGWRILRVVESVQYGDEEGDQGGVFVACGPFQMWEAQRVTTRRRVDDA